MNLELEKYLPFMEGIDAPLSDKEEMLRTVWSIIESQVDQAFGVHPVQNCERNQKTLPKSLPCALESETITTVSRFNRASVNEATYKRKAE